MEAKRSWRQKIKKHWRTILVAVIGVVFIAWIITGILPNGTGFNGYNQVTIAHTISGPSAGTVTRTEVYQPGKTFWDLLQLLIIPLALAVIAYLFNRSERKNEQRIASDNQGEAALQGYIDKMSELLLKEHPSESKPEYEEVRKIARVRTLTILTRLDPRRKRSVLQFLYESDLIVKDGIIIDLKEADLSGADLSGVRMAGANLSKANLGKADLSKAILFEANLWKANLRKADLHNAILSVKKVTFPSQANLNEADLSEADLSGAILDHVNLKDAILRGTNLSGADLTDAVLTDADLDIANLKGAKVTQEQLATARSLKGATLPDGILHP